MCYEPEPDDVKLAFAKLVPKFYQKFVGFLFLKMMNFNEILFFKKSKTFNITLNF